MSVCQGYNSEVPWDKLIKQQKFISSLVWKPEAALPGLLMAGSLRVLHGFSSPRVCVLTSFSYKDTCQVRLGPTGMTAF